jgi:ABC-type Mn2+/Zn2+ transport system permease subunit
VSSQLWLAAALGAGAGVIGLAASAELDVAAGGSVALAAVAMYALIALARPAGRRRGAGARRSPVEALGAGR